ncbi:MAG TPA: hypothetical protein VKB25_00025 [Conexibacter sp.]|nr:hypothetical protein [Conexibacter sp.]
MLTAAILLLTAFVAGITGAWSPCGFSMVETLGSRRAHEGARTVWTSCATFALGALAGGAVTFTALAALGSLLGGAGSEAALVVAGTVALSCAFGELRGVRIVPQIRRQVPESWRRTMPLPLAAGLYGVLLGLGFTTFVLTLAVWALAGISVAIGDVQVGLLIGLGFGAGRALPVVLMAPRYTTLGQRLELKMAEQPALLRRLRLADGALLATLAVVLLSTGSSASAAQLVVSDGTDPSRAGSTLAWERLGGAGAVLLDGAARSELPSQAAAVGGRYVATRTGDAIEVRDRASGAVVVERAVADATQLAVSNSWLVWRTTSPGGGDRLWALPLPVAQAVPAQDAGIARLVAGATGRKAIDRPALSGDHLAYAATTRGDSRILIVNLATQRRRLALITRTGRLSQPSLDGGRLLYVQSSWCSQRLRLLRTSRLTGRPRTLLRIGATVRRDEGHEHHYTTQGSEPGRCPRGTPAPTDRVLWTTALAGRDAYVTLLRPGAGDTPATARIVRVGA